MNPQPVDRKSMIGFCNSRGIGKLLGVHPCDKTDTGIQLFTKIMDGWKAAISGYLGEAFLMKTNAG